MHTKFRERRSDGMKEDINKNERTGRKKERLKDRKIQRGKEEI